MPPLLSIEQVAYRADGRMILDGVELEVGEQQIHALLGANGTGKTTIDVIVTGILR
ncbi:MAG: hypothetical protein HYU44_17280 [Betaproteobacteria bacterium]|nr:hypothetical protein [Betaproteobacteria bacterium]MBI2289106.1 hypothetical protein [Betaproteobacteria bacterium]MBI3055805.1 hypothetical protein [Betaproteobacteria bacterium]